MATEIRWPQRPAPFWTRFVRNGACLEWTGQRDKDGYGLISQYVNGHARPVRVSRLIYQKLKGPLSDGQIVRHTCDNPPCGEPEHLIPGTHADNTADKMVRGRHVSGMALHPERAAKGATNGSAQLTEDDVREIRRLRAAGVSQQVAARQLGVSPSAVKDIDHRRTWRWLS